MPTGLALSCQTDTGFVSLTSGRSIDGHVTVLGGAVPLKGISTAKNRIDVESCAKVMPARLFVTQHRFGIAVCQNSPAAHNIIPIRDCQRFRFAVIRQQDGDTLTPQIGDHVLNAVDRHRIDSGKGLVE